MDTITTDSGKVLKLRPLYIGNSYGNEHGNHDVYTDTEEVFEDKVKRVWVLVEVE